MPSATSATITTTSVEGSWRWPCGRSYGDDIAALSGRVLARSSTLGDATMVTDVAKCRSAEVLWLQGTAGPMVVTRW